MVRIHEADTSHPAASCLDVPQRVLMPAPRAGNSPRRLQGAALDATIATRIPIRINGNSSFTRSV